MIAVMCVNRCVYVPAGAITVCVMGVVLVWFAVCVVQDVTMCPLSQSCTKALRIIMKTLTDMTYVGMTKTQSLKKEVLHNCTHITHASS